ncbi:MAG: YdbL family protein [Ahniella sp.]|nr:YdbL family protein [Ahniella sp.]
MAIVRWAGMALMALMLAACVTVNVYFPEAEIEDAAKEFVDEVIGEQPQGTAPQAMNWRLALVTQAYAAADVTIQSPAIKTIQSRMATRFQDKLAAHFDSGALGFKRDGTIEVRDLAKVPLSERSGLKQWVAEDNRDRDAVYREIAVANEHPEWEPEIRTTFAEQWISQARKGWYFQAADGTWKQK